MHAALIDCNYLAHAAWHTVGPLDNGILFGFLSRLPTLAERIKPDTWAFCWDDHKDKSLRRQRCPTYKAARVDHSKDTAQEKLERAAAMAQFDAIKALLPELGFKNVITLPGLEADDVIANICRFQEGQFTIVSEDHDLFQLIGRKVRMFRPSKGKFLYAEDVQHNHGITCRRWADAMALAGCSGDGVPGCRGVAMPTAAQFLNNQLKEGSAKWKAVTEYMLTPAYAETRSLVELPFISQPVTLVPDELKLERMGKIFKRLKMYSILADKARWLELVNRSKSFKERWV